MAQVLEIDYGRLNNQELIIPANNFAYLLKVPFPAFGFLAKVLVQQSAGVPVSFTVNVFNSGLGLIPGAIDPALLPAGRDVCRVIDQLFANAGEQAALFIVWGQPFRNVDGPDPLKSGVNQAGLGAGFTDAQRYLYLLIRPATGAGPNSKWEAALCCWMD